MARFWKERRKKGIERERENARTQSFRVFMRTLTTPRLFKGEGKVRGSKASLVNSGVIAECATPQSAARGDRANCPQLRTTYRSLWKQKANYEWNTRVNRLHGLKTRNCENWASVSRTAARQRSLTVEAESSKVTTMRTRASDPSALHSCRHLSRSVPPTSSPSAQENSCNMTMTLTTFRKQRRREGIKVPLEVAGLCRGSPHLSWCCPRVSGDDVWSLLWIKMETEDGGGRALMQL